MSASNSSPWDGCTRYVQQTRLDPIRQRAVLEQGKRQGAMSLERYHYLRAAIRGDFDVTTVPPDFSRAQLFPRQGVLFDRYQPYSLKSVLGIKLHPREDGTVHPEDLALYARGLRESWKCREAEILYCLAEGREFWNMVLNYHSAAATTGYKPWDRLFAALKRNDFDKSIIPCMWFAREIGCLAPDCPFKHDKAACVKDREKVLEKRRNSLGRPSARVLALRERRAIQEYRATQRQVVPASNTVTADDDALALARLDEEDEEDEDEVDPEIHRIFQESASVRKICSNPDCLVVRMRRGDGDGNDMKMLQCSRCTVATYCSNECQKADWKRHKKQPCKPFEDIVTDDDLWNEFGQLKGTSWFPINGE